MFVIHMSWGMAWWPLVANLVCPILYYTDSVSRTQDKFSLLLFVSEELIFLSKQRAKQTRFVFDKFQEGTENSGNLFSRIH